MRLSDVLSKDYTPQYTQIEGFINNKPTPKQPKKIDVGKVTINCICKNCSDIRSFTSNSSLQLVFIRDGLFSIDTRLTCPSCNESVAAWFLVDCENQIDDVAPKVRMIKKSIKYTDKVAPLYTDYPEYGDLLEKADIAYTEGLGAGSIVYLRKIFEMVTKAIADANGIDLTNDKGERIHTFKKVLNRVNAKVDFIPKEFSQDGYRLFGALSDVVHGDFDEAEGVARYQTLRRLIIGVLDNIKNRADFANAREVLGWTDAK